jgi:hypothetical protein
VPDLEPQVKECATLSGRHQGRYCRAASSILGRWRSVRAMAPALLMVLLLRSFMSLPPWFVLRLVYAT